MLDQMKIYFLVLHLVNKHHLINEAYNIAQIKKQ